MILPAPKPVTRNPGRLAPGAKALVVVVAS